MTADPTHGERSRGSLSTTLGDEQVKLALQIGRLGTWQIDVETGVMASSDTCKANYGRAAHESLTYQELASLVVDADRERWQDVVAEALSKGAPFEMEYGVQWPDGSLHFVLVRGSCRTDADGRVTTMLGVSADVTEQRLAREKLGDAQVRLEATLAAGEIGTWTWDITEDRVVADRNLAHFFGVSEADAQGGSISAYIDAIHPDDRERAGTLIQGALASGERFEAKYRVRDAEGRYRTVVARGHVECAPNGRPLRLPGVVIDVSREEELLARTRAAQAEAEGERRKLQTSEERLLRVVDASGAGLWELDASTRQVVADRRLTMLMGLDEAQAFTFEAGLAAVHPGDRERVSLAVSEALAGRNDGRYLVQFRVGPRAGEPLRWVESRATVSFDEQGKALHLAGAMIDISARKRAEEASEGARVIERQLRREAEQANRAKDEFLAMLGHEMRNPLAPITTALQLMKLRSEEAFVKERTVIERQVEHLTRLVDDLLDISRITSGKIAIERRLVSVSSVVAAAIEIASPLIEERQHHLDVSVPTNGLAVQGDPIRLAQAIANLLTNAAKYTEGSGGRIRIAAALEGSEVVIRVSDNGVGIASEMLPHVFGLFVQERQSSDRALGGLGLGLTIARTLVELHGGKISARSAGRHQGSEFTIQLPSAPGLVSAAAEPPPRAAVQGAAERKHDSRRILVVDDNTDAAELLASSLEFLGHEARVAHDGPSALSVVASFTPDLAVLDIGLPVMDGYELGRRLREQPGLARLRLVALTGYGQSSDRQRSADAGFQRHLVKPVQLAQLESIIDEQEP